MCTFWKGSIEIDIPTNTFWLHQTITGRIILRLKKPIKARSLVVRLEGQEMVEERDSDGDEWNHWSTFYDRTITLGGDDVYTSNQYEFEMDVPRQARRGVSTSRHGSMKILEGALERAGAQGTIEWHIIARLDIPMGLDIKDKRQIFFKGEFDDMGHVEGESREKSRANLGHRKTRIAKGMKDTPDDEVYAEGVLFCPQCETPYHHRKGGRRCNICGCRLPENEGGQNGNR